MRPVSYLGELAILGGEALGGLVRGRADGRETLAQMYRLGVQSLPLVALTCFFTGAVMALQVAFTLSAYGAATYVGAFTGVSMVKELGPVLTAVMVAARVGAGITAELGAMTVTEQVDAIRALGASPVRQLVVPRVLALLLLVPVLTTMGMAFGIFGGLAIALTEVGQGPEFYLAQVRDFILISDILLGLAKTLFFAFAIGIIACRNGLRVRGGATGVGQATTETVVYASITVFISNFFLSKAFMVLQGYILRWLAAS